MNISELRNDIFRPARTPRQQGLSLVELMVALAVSTLILIGLVQVFVNSRLMYDTDEGVARLQENGRFAMEFLARDIRMAGNMGCLGNIPGSADELLSRTINYVSNSTTSEIFNLARGGIEGFEYAGTAPTDTYLLTNLYPATTVTTITYPTLVTNLAPGTVRGSDILVLRFMDGDGAGLESPYTDAAQIFVEQSNSLQDNQVMIVTDCKRASIFQATTVSSGTGTTNVAHAVGGNPGNTCANWGTGSCPGHDYQSGSQIARFNTMVYYIGTGAYGGPSLMRRSWPTGTARDDELVEGVENMQILYGLNTDSDSGANADRYMPASDSASDSINWSQVVSVRVALLVAGQISGKISKQSEQTVDTATYSAAGVTLRPPANDRHQRRVFTATVKLRNR